MSKCYHCSGWEYCPYRKGEECSPSSEKGKKKNEYNCKNKRNFRKGKK